MEEIWKDVIGYEGLYMVSNLGRIKSITRSQTMKNVVRRMKRGVILNVWSYTNGYKFVCLMK